MPKVGIKYILKKRNPLKSKGIDLSGKFWNNIHVLCSAHVRLTKIIIGVKTMYETIEKIVCTIVGHNIFSPTVKPFVTSGNIIAFKEGDNQPLGIVYQCYAVQLGFVAYRYLHNEDDSKDVVMEVFNKLIKMDAAQRNRVPETTEAFKNWLFLVAKNYCLDVIKHNKIILSYQQNNTSEQSVVSTAERSWDNETARFLLSKLPVAEQKVCIMHFEGFSHEEISDSLKISYNTVRNQLSSGKKKIRRYISDGLIVLTGILFIFIC